MIFHENCLLADNSHEISYHNFFQNLVTVSQNLSSGNRNWSFKVSLPADDL